MNEIKQRLEQLAQKNPSVNLMYRGYLASHPTIESYQDLCVVLVNALEIMWIQNEAQLKRMYETHMPPYLLTANPDGTQTIELYRP